MGGNERESQVEEYKKSNGIGGLWVDPIQSLDGMVKQWQTEWNVVCMYGWNGRESAIIMEGPWVDTIG